MTTEVLQAFADAWNRHDVDALMSFMTEDCVFEASAGPDVCGTRYTGRAEVRAGFAEVWETFPDAHWGNARHFVVGDRGVSEWTFTGTRATALAWRSTVAICSPFATARSLSRIPTGRTGSASWKSLARLDGRYRSTLRASGANRFPK